MNLQASLWAVGGIVLVVGAGCVEQEAPTSGGQASGKSSAPTVLDPVAGNDPTTAALDRALDELYKSRAIHRATVERLGELRPFTHAIEAEQRHIDRLLTVYSALDVKAPEDRWERHVESATTLRAACDAAVGVELDSIALYDELLTQVDSPAVRPVLVQLWNASTEHLLPAFRRCLDR